MRQGVISYFSSGPSRQTWYLATATDRVQFYVFDVPDSIDTPIKSFSLIDSLDRSVLPAAGDRKTAANWAARLGLKQWIYVKV